MEPAESWIDRFRQLVCKLYQSWGGDCDELGLGASEWIDTLQNEYDTVGAPTFATEAERTAYLGTLDDLDDHLDNAANSLSPADDTQIRTLSSNLRTDVMNQGS